MHVNNQKSQVSYFVFITPRYIQVKYFGEQFVKKIVIKQYDLKDNQENNALRAAVHLFALWYEVD